MLEFCFDARLVDEDERVRVTAHVIRSIWKTKYRPTKQQAAWAFVRGQCELPGLWLCMVTLAGASTEMRVIEVTECEGAIFRRDLEVAGDERTRRGLDTRTRPKAAG